MSESLAIKKLVQHPKVATVAQAKESKIYHIVLYTSKQIKTPASGLTKVLDQLNSK